MQLWLSALLVCLSISARRRGLAIAGRLASLCRMARRRRGPLAYGLITASV
jgi:hypothetical protein